MLNYKDFLKAFFHFFGFSDLCSLVENGLCFLWRWAPSLRFSYVNPRDQLHRGMWWVIGLQICDIQVLPDSPTLSNSAWMCGGMGCCGILATSFVVFPSQQWWPAHLYSVPTAPPLNPGINCRVHAQVKEKGVSILPILGFTDTVLCTPTWRVRRGGLWEVKEGSQAP